MNGMKYPYCALCRHNFPMDEMTYDGYERSGKTFYCPEGHSLAVRQDSVVSELRASERCLRLSRDTVSRLYKRVECVRGVITRQRNRLVRGVCPYCAKNVAEIDEGSMLRHIKARHRSSIQ